MKTNAIKLALAIPAIFLICQLAGQTQTIAPGWQTYASPSTPFTIQYPPGWSATTNPKTGSIELSNSSNVRVSVLPFFLQGKNLSASDSNHFLDGLLTALAPQEHWQPSLAVGSNAAKSTCSSAEGNSAAAMEYRSNAMGTGGRLCPIRVPKGGQMQWNLLTQMLTTFQYRSPAPNMVPGTATPTSMMNGMAGSMSGRGTPGSMLPGQGMMPGQSMPMQGYIFANMSPKQMLAAAQQLPPGTKLPNTPFSGYRQFVDPTENGFTCEVPTGWQTKGGMDRFGSVDVRPWVTTLSPDNLIFAFTGDGHIGPFSMPTATGMSLGYYPGGKYGTGTIRSYVPARVFVEEYARSHLKAANITNVQIVVRENHPDVARAYNGTVGATASEAASIKCTGMYGNIPVIAYFIASTKATVQSGTGMWWVTLIAGDFGPADREQGGLQVALHMLQSFHLNGAWQANSLANTKAVSNMVAQQSDAALKSISSRYWSQQAANDAAMNSWSNNQAIQDHTADNFSNYIRGVENVADPTTGTQYQVSSGPANFWINDQQGVIGGSNYQPGPDWRQLMSVP